MSSTRKLDTQIAIVGMAGMFPGAASLEEFWKNLIGLKSAGREVPAGRWTLDPAAIKTQKVGEADRVISTRGCYLDPFELNCAGLNLDPAFVRGLDPLFHVTLEVGRTAFGDAQMQNVNRERVGVALANIALPTDSISKLSRKILQQQHAPASITREDAQARYVTGLPAGLLARALNLGGGAFTLDAACASSLYAIEMACRALQRGEVDAMLAGGVSRPDCLYTQMGFTALHALSPSGRCAPFDESADGLLVGEGAGIFVLKRIDDALQDGDHIYAVIRGIGLSNDIGGKLLAPDTEGQMRAMQAAYQDAQLRPSDIDLIECHGTGTPVGDGIELQSLRTLWEAASEAGSGCTIGSVKASVGHLLTAAGAAGLAKTLLALKHKTLPPQANFGRSKHLEGSPFTVRRQAAPWERRDAVTPRRAAVSAFGFGGINAHVLIEEYDPETLSLVTQARARTTPRATTEPASPVAIVGMGARFGRLKSLRAFGEALFRGESEFRKLPPQRWRGRGEQAPVGSYIDELEIDVAEFRIPPNEISQLLPQQLLMLQVAKSAMKDAGYLKDGQRQTHLRASAMVGMSLDSNTANFDLRWTSGLPQGPERDQLSPPLNPTRTLGALGGMIASRVARELDFGGPSFTLSSEESSGLRSVEVAVRALQDHKVDLVLAGAVDLTGEVRTAWATDQLAPFSRGPAARPFDKNADGALPGEGAAAVVLKRLDDAIRDGDRIYSVIEGLGVSTGPNKTQSIDRALSDAGVGSDALGYIEASASGFPTTDTLEAEDLKESFGHSQRQRPCALGSAKSVIGDTGAAAGLASLVKTSLCLFHQILPPLPHFKSPREELALSGESFHVPTRAIPWMRDRALGPRRALVCSIGSDGTAVHAVLRGWDHKADEHSIERAQPLGARSEALFAIEGNGVEELTQRVRKLESLASSHAATPIETLARSWNAMNPASVPLLKMGAALLARDTKALKEKSQELLAALQKNPQRSLDGLSGIFYSFEALGPRGELAFVYPGSGNHFIGMGSGVALEWPQVMRSLDDESQFLASYFMPEWHAPYRLDWTASDSQIQEAIAKEQNRMIFGQVTHGVLMSDVLRSLGLRPQAAIGYSLGESTALFSLRAWRDRDEMLRRMIETPLFANELAGRCEAARRLFGISQDAHFEWKVALVNRSVQEVRESLKRNPLRAYVLISNTPDECVVGGEDRSVNELVSRLGAQSWPIEGVSTVHCEVVDSVAEAYRNLHLHHTTPPEGIRFYSAHLASSYELNSNSAADSIIAHALRGFDYPKLIEQTYRDGVRVFVEVGPQASCTRAISKILAGKPHVAVAASIRGQDDTTSVLRVLARLWVERVDIDLKSLYGTPSQAVAHQSPHMKDRSTIRVPIEIPVTAPQRPSHAPRPSPPPRPPSSLASPKTLSPIQGPRPMLRPASQTTKTLQSSQASSSPTVHTHPGDALLAMAQSTAAAHGAYLANAAQSTRALTQILTYQTQILSGLDTHASNSRPEIELAIDLEIAQRDPEAAQTPVQQSVAYDREQCLEFARGQLSKVFGESFADVDTFPTRVRLPDEPLMLVDRIVSVSGEAQSLRGGACVTEHDVKAGAWYLDNGRMPVCITVEAGQADLFLSAYLGIDRQTRGERRYRLLDAKIVFHRELPRPGETVRYEIEIDRFIKQGSTYLFFFRFEGYIGNTPLLTMNEGCAGFFSQAQLEDSQGVVLTIDDRTQKEGRTPPRFETPVAMRSERFDDEALKALREGDLAAAFGANFANLPLEKPVTLPSGRMKLIDRVVSLEPKGGRFGLGQIRAEADIHPNDWFLTCHFVDDKVMPGTLMYECCLHTLRVYLLRMGWIGEENTLVYEPVAGIQSKLQCRGQVLTTTQVAAYEIEIKEIGFNPAPYVIADAIMFADGKRIVRMSDMSVQLTGLTEESIQKLWSKNPNKAAVSPVFNTDRITAFAIGKPSEAFGEPYRVFDSERKIARLPGPPFQFLDRITDVSRSEAWKLKSGSVIEAQYDVPPDAWYFDANRQSSMPYSVLLETALQPCGWLAAYLGSALRSPQDLSFRNLGGKALQHEEIFADAGTLTSEVKLTSFSEAGGMIIQKYDLKLSRAGRTVFEGDTQFGFFSKEALAQQVGVRGAAERRFAPDAAATAIEIALPNNTPLTPSEVSNAFDPSWAHQALLPASAYRMIEKVQLFRNSGPHQLGFLRGETAVHPDAWFFKAHFYQDPVWPGSLGLESFLQLLKVYAMDRYSELKDTHRFEPITIGVPHTWAYRGQVVPHNKRVRVEAVITRAERTAQGGALVMANGFLEVDGIIIYEMTDFGLRLV